MGESRRSLTASQGGNKEECRQIVAEDFEELLRVRKTTKYAISLTELVRARQKSGSLLVAISWMVFANSCRHPDRISSILKIAASDGKNKRDRFLSKGRRQSKPESK